MIPHANYQIGKTIIWSGPISAQVYVCADCIDNKHFVSSTCQVVGKPCKVCSKTKDCIMVPPCDNCGIPLCNTKEVFPHFSDKSKAYCAECAPTCPIRTEEMK